MKPRILTCIIAMTIFAALAVLVRLAAQDNQKSNHSKFITFDAPGAGSLVTAAAIRFWPCVRLTKTRT